MDKDEKEIRTMKIGLGILTAVFALAVAFYAYLAVTSEDSMESQHRKPYLALTVGKV